MASWILITCNCKRPVSSLHSSLTSYRYRSREHDTEDEPWDPITGGASALVGTLSSMSMGIADLPTEALKALQIHPDAPKSKAKSKQSSSANPAAESTKAGEPSKEPEEQGSAQNSNDAGPAVAHAVVRNMANATTESEPSNTAAPAAPAAPSSQIESAPTKFDMETAMETGKGVFQFASAGIKSPMDFTLGRWQRIWLRLLRRHNRTRHATSRRCQKGRGCWVF